MKKTYELSHFIDANYFVRDTKTGFVASYKTNSHGKRYVSASLKGNLNGEIHFSTYQEMKRAVELLTKVLKTTRGRWYIAPKKKVRKV